MTETATTRQIAHATDLRDRIRDLYTAAAEDDAWARQLQAMTEQAVRSIRMASRDRSIARRLPTWRAALVPAQLIREVDDEAGAQAQRDHIAAEITAQRERIRDTTDLQLATMTGAEINEFIDNAKAMR